MRRRSARTASRARAASGARPARAALRLGAAGLCALSLTACSAIERRHGYTPDDATLSLIQIGVDTRESVAEKVGEPVSEGVLGDDDYYYVSSLQRSFAFRPVVEARREVVAISFGPSGRVSNVERFGLERGRIVPLSRRVTEANVRGPGLLRQLFGSLGQISAEDILQND